MTQGSIVGPKHFILYASDLCNISKLAKYILFANTNFQKTDTMCGVLDKMYKWFAINKIYKTNYILFGNRVLRRDVIIHIRKIIIILLITLLLHIIV